MWVGGYERGGVGWIVRGEWFVRWAWYMGYVGGTCCEVGFKRGGGIQGYLRWVGYMGGTVCVGKRQKIEQKLKKV